MSRIFTKKSKSSSSTKSTNNKSATKTKVKSEPELVEDIPTGVRLEAHCMKHKESVVVSKGQLVKTSNGRLMVRGIHKSCGTKVNVFISQGKYDDAVKAVKKAKK